MAKIYISPYQNRNAEWPDGSFIFLTLRKLAETIKARMPEHEVLVGADDNKDGRIQEANAWPADLFLSLRVFPQDTDSMELWACGSETGKSWAACASCKRWLDSLQLAATNIRTDTAKTPEIWQTNMTSVCCFVGGRSAETQSCLDTQMDDIAQAFADGVSAWLNTQPNNQADPQPDPPADPPTTPTEICDNQISADAELGAAFRKIFAAFWEAQNGR